MLWLGAGCAPTPATAPASGPAEPGDSKGGQTAYTSMTMIDLETGMRLAAECKYSDAIKKLSTVLPVLEHSNDHKNAAECAFWMGFCEEKLGHYQLAANHYKKVVQQFSRQPVAEQAKLRLGVLPSAESRPKSPD